MESSKLRAPWCRGIETKLEIHIVPVFNGGIKTLFIRHEKYTQVYSDLNIFSSLNMGVKDRYYVRDSRIFSGPS